MSRSSTPLRLAVGLLVLLPAQVARSQPTSDSCADPYWADSLRCRIFPLEPPQPLPVPPATPAAIREYTRVDLESDWTVRCLDGTRPILYVDPAVGGPSNRWLISLTGGGSCWASDADGDLVVDGRDCADQYQQGEAAEMGTANEPAMKNLSDTPGQANGILRTSPALNPRFAGYHRLRIEKCSYDRYNGRATHEDVELDDTTTYDLYLHGRRIVELALDELRGDPLSGGGLTYTTWVDQGGVVTAVTESLPPLESAEQILFWGHSGAGHGLHHSVDGLAERLRGWAGFSGDVRVLIDANFLPSPENEAAFDPLQNGDLFDHSFGGSTPEVGAYDGEVHYTDSFYAEQYDAYLEDPGDSLATVHDASCVAVHEPLGEEWMCRDRVHVLANHLTTPAFVREDFSDPNSEHTVSGLGHLVLWGPWGAYPHCPAPLATCPPRIDVGDGSPYEERLQQQAATILADLRFRSELATGEDASGPVPTLFLWMPDCGSHAGASDEAQWNRVALANASSSVTMRELLESFVAAPATGLIAGRIAGFGGDAALCDGDLPFADGFESRDFAAWSGLTP